MARAETQTGGRNATAAIIPGDRCISVGKPFGDAPDGWSWQKLTDLARLESGHTPSRKVPEYWGGDVPWIGIRDATGNHGREIFDTAERTNELGIANSSARICPAGTICLSRTASVGYVVKMGRPMATSQDFVNWVCGDALNPDFLKYALLSETRALRMFAVGSVHPTIYFPEVKAMHLAAPSRREQDRIVSVLQPLDDKIELNRRMNETMETMARAIFKDWFVYFGPTRAKMEGRAPYLASETWKLFPDRFDEDGKPKTWRNGRLSDVLELAYGKSLPARDRADGFVPVYGSGGISGWHNEALVDGQTIIVGRKGTVGSVYWESRASYPIDTVFYVRSVHPMTYCLHLLESLGLETMNTDAAVPGLNRENAYRLDVTFNELATFAFDALVSPMRNRMDANLRENETLAATRDLLLPKLMSGELRIRDAEAMVAAAA
jgi:type I restriction enzyme S subunit